MKWFAYSVLAIFIFVSFVPTVQAEQDNTYAEIEVNFQPGNSDETSTEANLMDESTVTLEKDIMIETLNGVEGKYYGPFLESSLFQFHHESRYFQFSTNFTIPPSVIMSGASTFWLRVPIVPSQYEAYHVFCSWGYYDILEGHWGDLFFGGPQITWPMERYDNVDDIWTFPDFWIGGFGTGMGPGNVWSTANGDTYQLLERPSGLYIEYKGVFHPDEEFVLCFTGLLNDGQYPQVYLSQERPTLDATQAFNFYEIYHLEDNDGDLIDYGYKYMLEEAIELSAAWAFIFTNGIGKFGMTSYKLTFRDSEHDYLSIGHYPEYPAGIHDDVFTEFVPFVTEYQNHSYISIYMPFSAVLFGPTFAGQNTLDWEVTVKLGSGYNAASNSWPMYFERTPYGLADTDTVTLRINSTENYLLFTVPYQVDFDWTVNPGVDPPYRVRMKIQFVPLQPCDVVFIGSDTGQPDYSGTLVSYRHENETASWSEDGITFSDGSWCPFEVNGHQMPLYFSLHWTDGLWAQINATLLYWVYDFGWGVGYSYHGQSRIYLYLDTGGWLFYNGCYADFAMNASNPDDEADTPWYSWLWEQILEMGIKIVGWVWDGLNWIWDTLVAIGSWIANTITSIIGWLISIIKDIAGKVTDIIEGMLYGFPMLVILFCASYFGEALYKGKLPRLTKERRLYRKIIKRPVKKVAKVVKKEYRGYKTARTRRLSISEQQRAAEYRQRFRLERQRERWRVGEKEYERQQEAVKRGKSLERKGVSYGAYDEKTRRSKRRVRYR